MRSSASGWVALAVLFSVLVPAVAGAVPSPEVLARLAALEPLPEPERRVQARRLLAGIANEVDPDAVPAPLPVDDQVAVLAALLRDTDGYLRMKAEDAWTLAPRPIQRASDADRRQREDEAEIDRTVAALDRATEAPEATVRALLAAAPVTDPRYTSDLLVALLRHGRPDVRGAALRSLRFFRGPHATAAVLAAVERLAFDSRHPELQTEAVERLRTTPPFLGRRWHSPIVPLVYETLASLRASPPAPRHWLDEAPPPDPASERLLSLFDAWLAHSAQSERRLLEWLGRTRPDLGEVVRPVLLGPLNPLPIPEAIPRIAALAVGAETEAVRRGAHGALERLLRAWLRARVTGGTEFPGAAYRDALERIPAAESLFDSAHALDGPERAQRTRLLFGLTNLYHPRTLPPRDWLWETGGPIHIRLAEDDGVDHDLHALTHLLVTSSATAFGRDRFLRSLGSRPLPDGWRDRLRDYGLRGDGYRRALLRLEGMLYQRGVASEDDVDALDAIAEDLARPPERTAGRPSTLRGNGGILLFDELFRNPREETARDVLLEIFSRPQTAAPAARVYDLTGLGWRTPEAPPTLEIRALAGAWTNEAMLDRLSRVVPMPPPGPELYVRLLQEEVGAATVYRLLSTRTSREEDERFAAFLTSERDPTRLARAEEAVNALPVNARRTGFLVLIAAARACPRTVADASAAPPAE